MIDRGGASVRLGQKLQQLATRVFAQWHLFSGGGIDRQELARRRDPEVGKLERLLRSGRRCADRKAARFCANLLDLGVALWLFVVEEGVEPTNNHAERLLRRGVLWRKNALALRW